MKRILVVILLSFFSVPSFAQGMYGFGIGLGYTTVSHSHITPAFEAYHLWRITPHIYAGGSLFLQRYSFLYDNNVDPAGIKYGDVVSIRQKSSYLFFSPKIDFGIGYRNKVHISLLGGAGVVMSAGQWSNTYTAKLATAGGGIGADTVAVYTGHNVPRILYRAGMSVSERIATHGYFNIWLSEEFSLLPGSLNKGGPNINTSYFSFTVGIMHKYPQVWRED